MTRSLPSPLWPIDSTTKKKPADSVRVAYRALLAGEYGADERSRVDRRTARHCQSLTGWRR
jgi:hypothetical protein